MRRMKQIRTEGVISDSNTPSVRIRFIRQTHVLSSRFDKSVSPASNQNAYDTPTDGISA